EQTCSSQGLINTYSQFSGLSYYLTHVIDTCIHHSGKTSEAGQQPLSTSRTHSLDFFQAGYRTSLGPTGAHSGNGQAMGLVPNLCNQQQSRSFYPQQKRLPLIGTNQGLQPHLASLPFGHPNQHPGIKPQSDTHLPHHFHLPLAPIYENNVRQRRIAIRHSRKAT